MSLINRYLPLIILISLYLAVSFFQIPIIENIWQYSFDDGTYSHAFIVPFICLYLYMNLYNDNELIFNKKVNFIALAFAILLGISLFVFTLALFPLGYRITIVLFITALIALIFKPTLRTLFPSLFLVFLLPIWGVLTPYLQQLSTSAVTLIMGYSGIPIFVEGNFISIPAGVFEIAGGCSGLRYLLVSLAISSLYIFLNIKNSVHASLFLTAAILGALITNWIRISGLILIGHYTNMESDLMQDHNSFGWYLYVPFMISLFYFGQRFIVETSTSKIQSSTTKMHSFTPFIIALLISAVASSFVKGFLVNSTFQVKAIDCQNLPTGFPAPQLINVSRECALKEGDAYKVTYEFDGMSLDNSVDFYLNKFSPAGWHITETKQQEDWNIIFAQKGIEKLVIKYQFQSQNEITSHLTELKKLKLKNALLGKSQSQLIWIVENMRHSRPK